MVIIKHDKKRTVNVGLRNNTDGDKRTIREMFISNSVENRKRYHLVCFYVLKFNCCVTLRNSRCSNRKSIRIGFEW